VKKISVQLKRPGYGCTTMSPPMKAGGQQERRLIDALVMCIITFSVH
jgi:hypothetical protein